jgi:hypothetical protein
MCLFSTGVALIDFLLCFLITRLTLATWPNPLNANPLLRVDARLDWLATFNAEQKHVNQIHVG